MCDGRGAECKFYVRGGVGYKIYRSKRARDYAFRTQKIFHAEGLAPAVGHKMSWWGRPGYTTELAEVPARMSKKRWNDLDRLCSRTKDLDFVYYDSHEGNIGYVKGKMVFIDFGPLCRPRRNK